MTRLECQGGARETGPLSCWGFPDAGSLYREWPSIGFLVFALVQNAFVNVNVCTSRYMASEFGHIFLGIVVDVVMRLGLMTAFNF